jgi:hypothetical protein
MCRDAICENAEFIVNYPTQVNLDWTKHASTFYPAEGDPSCGTQARDFWFSVRVPAYTTVEVFEINGADVRLQDLDTCESLVCTQSVQNPDGLKLENTSDVQIERIVVVSENILDPNVTINVEMWFKFPDTVSDAGIDGGKGGFGLDENYYY